MPNIKHIGRLKNNKRRVIVAYRTLPGDPYSALVVMTESLPADEHDALVKLVESPAGQSSYELAEAMARTYLSDGRNMLSGFHITGQLKKVATHEIEMTPDNKSVIDLNKLNEVIAQQKGVSLDELSLKPTNQEPTQVTESAQPTPVTEVEPMSNDALAAQLRSQADAMFKEAKRLREQADEINPTKKKSAKTTESV